MATLNKDLSILKDRSNVVARYKQHMLLRKEKKSKLLAQELSINLN